MALNLDEDFHGLGFENELINRAADVEEFEEEAEDPHSFPSLFSSSLKGDEGDDEDDDGERRAEEDKPASRRARFFAPDREVSTIHRIFNKIAMMGVEEGANAEQLRDYLVNERMLLVCVRYCNSGTLLVFLFSRLSKVSKSVRLVSQITIATFLAFMIYAVVRYFAIATDINGERRGRLFFYLDIVTALIIAAYISTILFFVL